MDAISNAYISIADFNLWVKITTNSLLTVADIPKILRYRYQHILDNWSSIKKIVESKISNYLEPDRARRELKDFDNFVNIEISRSNRSSVKETQLMSRYFTVLDLIFITDIPILKQEQVIIDNEIKRVRNFNKSNFISIRESIVAGRDAIADSIGGTDSNYNEVYRRSSLNVLARKNINDIMVSASMQDIIGNLDHLLANSSQINGSVAKIDPFAFARANANNPNINIKSFNSSKLVRLNHGESLQKLALRFFNDEEKWIEIAIANGLKPPYIDEVGQYVNIISANGNQINLPQLYSVIINGVTKSYLTKDRLSTNQIILISSNTLRDPEQRMITSVRSIPISGEVVIELDGESDLSKFLKSDTSKILAYQPNTINSGFFIAIPTMTVIDQKVDQPTPWFLTSKGIDEKNAGVDFALDFNGDLQFTSNSDLFLSYAMENAIQAIRIKVESSLGDLFKHLEFGIDTQIGSVNSAKAKNMITESISKQVLDDSRFERLDYLTVQSISSGSASGYLVKLGVTLAGGTTVIPISFSVNKT